MSNLLKDASILLTPTGYDNGSMNAIKPEDGDGDFTFVRNSAATRVNAQGLVENVQIISSDLVTNGDFSQIGTEEVTNGNFSQIGSEEVTNGNFSQEGAEEVTNGDFATDSDWNKGTGWSISGGTANTDGTSSSEIRQNNVTIVGKQYKYSFTISNSGGGVFNARLRNKSTGTPILNFSNEGTYSGTFTSNGTFIDFVTLSNNTASFSIDNVSVKEVGQNWTLDTGWSIGNDKANFNTSGNSSIQQSLSLTSGKTYRVQISGELISGGLKTANSGLGFDTPFTLPLDAYYTYDGTKPDNIEIRTIGASVGSITNISVKEVGQDWSVFNNIGSSTNIILGALNIVTDGVFTNATQTSVLTGGNSYRLTYEITANAVVGNLQVTTGDAAVSIAVPSTVGTHTVYFEASGSAAFGFKRGGGAVDVTITNISVKEVLQDWGAKDGTMTLSDSGALLFDNSSGNSQGGAFQNVGLVDGKIYQMTITMQLLTGVQNRRIGLKTSRANGTGQSTVHEGSALIVGGAAVTETFTFTPASGDVSIQPFCDESNATYTIDNVSVKEVTNDTNIPRINYEGFSFQDSLGSELITNGDFANDGNWIKGTGWTISNGSANGLNATGDLQQSNVIESGKYYEVTYTITNYVAGSVRVELPNNSAEGITRSANGTYTEKILSVGTIVQFDGRTSFTGSIDNVSVKEFLGQVPVPNSGCGEWLLEPQSTNLITYSSDFSNASWRKGSNTIVTNNYAASPEGKQNATRIQMPDISGTFMDLFLSGFGGSALTVTFYAKNNGGVTDINTYALNGTLLTISLTDKWVRYTVNGTAGASVRVGIDNISGGVSDFLLYGFQAEQQSFGTSFIPTSGASATRNQDIATNSGNASLINTTEGTLYAEIAALANDSTSREIHLTSSSDNSALVNIKYGAPSKRIEYLYRTTGYSTQANFFKDLVDSTLFLKIAATWKLNEFKLFINGLQIGGTDTSGNVSPSGTFDTLRFQNFFGKNKALAVYKEALTDVDLRCLTYPPAVATTFDLNFKTIAEQFTFTRGSEATFVNAKGLIESTNQIGSELITNGDFSGGGADWLFAGGAEATEQGARINNTITGTNAFIKQSNSNFTIGKSFVLEYDVVATNGKTLVIEQSSAITLNTSTLGNNRKINFQWNIASTGLVIKRLTTGTDVTIDNVSLKEVTTATNTPRLDYSTGTEAFLLEPQSTNLVIYSEDFNGDGFAPINATTVESNYSLSPEGVNNSTKVSGADGTSRNQNNLEYNLANLTSSTNYTFSLYVRSDNTTDVTLGLFDTTTGANRKQSFAVTNAWQRFSFTAETDTSTIAFNVWIGGTSADIEVWGAQVEEKSFSTSLIPTSAATATRNQETCVNATPVINSTEGTLYAEVAALANDVTSKSIALSDGTSANRILFRYDSGNRLLFFVISGGVIQASESFTTDILNNLKFAFKWKLNDFAVWVNGVEVETDTIGNTPVGLSELSFDNGSGGQFFFGNTRGLKVYPEALADVQLEDLTKI